MQAPPSAEQGLYRLPTSALIWLVFGLLFLFLVAIQMLGSSIKLLGSETAGELVRTFDNPFAALAVGVLATVLVQSSSTTKSTIVGLVGSGSQLAAPMPLGASCVNAPPRASPRA